MDARHRPRRAQPIPTPGRSAGDRDDWERTARNLKVEIDEDPIEAYRRVVSMPFQPGEHGCAATKREGLAPGGACNGHVAVDYRRHRVCGS